MSVDKEKWKKFIGDDETYCIEAGVMTNKTEELARELEPCPFCGTAPIFPESKDVLGTCYDAGCEGCGIPTISIQIIDCFGHPRSHVHDSWDEGKLQYEIKYIEVARQEAIKAWSNRFLPARGKQMPQTPEAFARLAESYEKTFIRQGKENSQLRAELNKLSQKYSKAKQEQREKDIETIRACLFFRPELADDLVNEIRRG